MGAWADAVGQSADAAVGAWLRFKKEQPKMALALSVLPITGQVTAAAEYYDALQRGDTVDAALAALQMLPMGGVVTGAKLAGQSVDIARSAGELAAAARTTMGPGARSQQFAGLLSDMAQERRVEAVATAGRAAAEASSDVANVADYLKNQTGQWAQANRK